MGWLARNHPNSGIALLQRHAKSWPIGVDISEDCIKMVQLRENGRSVSVLASGAHSRPHDIKPDTAPWQRWAIDMIRQTISDRPFRGNNVAAAMPCSQVFTDHIRIPPAIQSRGPAELEEFVLSKIKQKVPFDIKDAMVKYIPTEEDNAMVIALQRTIIDRHLAIYENAGLNIKSICVWPVALTATYTRFFARRKTDLDAVVMLLQIDSNRTNIVVCRHKNLLFARSIPIGTAKLDEEATLARLTMELTGCKRQFATIYRNVHIERSIFLADQQGTKELCATIAKQLEMPAQMGDCLAAVTVPDPVNGAIERRENRLNWAVAFGLSLS
jgi:Tfp pilus assembly PilM family ATPase